MLRQDNVLLIVTASLTWDIKRPITDFLNFVIRSQKSVIIKSISKFEFTFCSQMEKFFAGLVQRPIKKRKFF